MQRLAAILLVCAIVVCGCSGKFLQKSPQPAIHKGETTITIKGKEKEKQNLLSVLTELKELYGDPTATFQGYEDDGNTVVLKVLHFDTGSNYEVVVHMLNGEVKTIFSNLK